MPCVYKLAFGVLVLTGLACAQAPSEPSSSAIVSPRTNEANGTANIEPVKRGTTEKFADDSLTVDPTSLLPDLPPVPHGNATLVGGTIQKLDRVRDKIVVHVFGGGQESVLFDPRTVVYRGTSAASTTELREGERIYLDTILDGSTVFARTIRLTALPQATGQSQGVVLKFRPDRNELTVRDAISPAPVRVRLSSTTRFLQGGRPVAANLLVPGSLISIDFSSEGNGHNTAREISILALPGTHYTFTGKVLHLDLRTGLVVLKSSTDNKTYEVYLSPSFTPDESLHPGATITVVTDYDGSRYMASNLTVSSQ